MRKAPDDPFKNRHVKLSMAVAAKAPAPPAADYILWDTQNATLGFGLRVFASGSKRWIMQKKIGRKPVKVTIGPFPGMTMTRALELAPDHLVEFAKNVNPNVVKRERIAADKAELERRRLTFGVAYREYEEDRAEQTPRQKPTSPRTRRDRAYARSYLENGPLWRVSLFTLSGDDLSAEYQRLQRLFQAGRKGGKTLAGGIMRWVRAALKHAVRKHKLTVDDPFVEFNKKFPGWAVAEPRTRIVAATEGQLARWWTAVEGLRQKKDGRASDAPTIADYLQLALLFGGRREEMLTLRWENVNLKDQTVVFPITKGHREHIIPYASFAKAILERRHAANAQLDKDRRSEYVFASSRRRRDGSRSHIQEPKKSIAEVASASGVDFASHDLRRTFATLMDEIGGVSELTIKRALNHAMKSTAGVHYVHHRLMRLRTVYQDLEDAILQEAGVVADRHNKDVPTIRIRRDGDVFLASIETHEGVLEVVGATGAEARRNLIECMDQTVA